MPLLIIIQKGGIKLRPEVVIILDLSTCVKWNPRQGVKEYTRNNMGENIKNRITVENEKIYFFLQITPIKYEEILGEESDIKKINKTLAT